jgi:hypothetical protein
MPGSEKNQTNRFMSTTEDADLTAELKRGLSFVRREKESSRDKSARSRRAKRSHFSRPGSPSPRAPQGGMTGAGRNQATNKRA